MGDFNFTNKVDGGNAQINQGQNVTATQNVGDSAIKLTFAPAMEAAKALPEGGDEALTAVEEFETAYGFADAIAAGDPLPAPAPEDEGRIAGILDRLAPYKDVARSVLETAKTVYPPASGWFDMIARAARGVAGLAEGVADILED